MLLVLTILRVSVNFLHCSTKRDLSIVTGHFFSHNEQSKLSDVLKKERLPCVAIITDNIWMKFKQTAMFSITTRDKHQHPQVAQQQCRHLFSWFKSFRCDGKSQTDSSLKARSLLKLSDLIIIMLPLVDYLLSLLTLWEYVKARLNCRSFL